MSLSLQQETTSPLTIRFASVWKALVKQPAQVATIAPSSRKLIEAIANRPAVQQATNVVELGPGAGGTTSGLLANMRPDAKLLAIEKTTAFGEALGRITDPRLEIVYADAIDLRSHLQERNVHHADVIVSGIPFSAIASKSAEQIVRSIDESLIHGGTFLAYQLQSNIERFACPLFGEATKQRVVWNVPPLTVYTWTKPATTTVE